MRRYTIEINQAQHVLEVTQDTPSNYTVKLSDGRTAGVQIVSREDIGSEPEISSESPAPNEIAPTFSGAVQNSVNAPMPGVVLSIEIAAGTTVSRGQTLLILEAMKMKNEIKAEKDGVITKIAVTSGDQVKHGDLLMEFGS